MPVRGLLGQSNLFQSKTSVIPEQLEKYTAIARWLMYVSSARLFYNLV